MVVRMHGYSTRPTSIRWSNHGCTLLMSNFDEAVTTMIDWKREQMWLANE
jgi:hypothetical protein